MEVIAGLAAWALGSVSSTVPGGAGLSALAGGFATSAAQFTSLLSPNASVHFRGSEAFHNSTLRWTQFGRPDFLVAVEVATESDVQQTVKLANTLHLPFLATTGSHGGISTLGQLNHGVQINLRKLNSVVIEEDGKSAIIGGGVLTKEVTDVLWAAGKQALTGVCECTSLLGPTLGGGHGVLQGRYGLGIDNIIEANVVLANGSLVTTSANSHPDLFWGLRGAGHNFGIVTSVKYKIYDVPEDNVWTLGTYIYTQDKLESVFELFNELGGAAGNQPVELLTWAYFHSLPEIDPNNAVITTYLIYEGTEEQAAPYSARFLALEPAVATSVPAQFSELPGLTYQGQDSIACLHGGYSAVRFPVSLIEYNIAAHRAAFNLFSEAIHNTPGLNNSFFISEGYAVQGVQNVPAESTAYPDRFNNVLISPVFIYFDSSLDGEALRVGAAVKKVLVDGTDSKKLYAYVNYATGGEAVEELYGHEEWRIEKLRSLKAKYDPENKFRFYAPIL